MMANWQVRGNNPGNPTKPPLSGSIHHTFQADQTLPAFLWAGVAGGLLRGWKPGHKLASVIGRYIGWKLFWQIMGALIGMTVMSVSGSLQGTWVGCN